MSTNTIVAIAQDSMYLLHSLNTDQLNDENSINHA